MFYFHNLRYAKHVLEIYDLENLLAYPKLIYRTGKDILNGENNSVDSLNCPVNNMTSIKSKFVYQMI